MEKMKKEIMHLLKECKMNDSTITGVMELLKTKENTKMVLGQELDNSSFNLPSAKKIIKEIKILISLWKVILKIRIILFMILIKT